MSQNPVDFMVKRTGLSRAEFANKFDFGKNLLIRLSQGRVASVTPRIEAALWESWRAAGISQDEFDAVYNTLSVDAAYRKWVHNRRITNRSKIPAAVTQDTSISPFARIVKAVGSVSKTAQLLVVPDVAVQRYADGRHKAMPETIHQALSTMAYPHLSALSTAQERWLKKGAE